MCAIISLISQFSALQFFEMLECGSVEEILCLPESAAILRGEVKLNLSAELMDVSIAYTPEEYAEHIAGICRLVNGEKNYHLTLLPQAPFRDLQMFTLKDAVAVLQCREPYTAFVFLNETLTRSVADYCRSLIERYAEDRQTILQALCSGNQGLCEVEASAARDIHADETRGYTEVIL